MNVFHYYSSRIGFLFLQEYIRNMELLSTGCRAIFLKKSQVKIRHENSFYCPLGNFTVVEGDCP